MSNGRTVYDSINLKLVLPSVRSANSGRGVMRGNWPCNIVTPLKTCCLGKAFHSYRT